MNRMLLIIVLISVAIAGYFLIVGKNRLQEKSNVIIKTASGDKNIYAEVVSDPISVTKGLSGRDGLGDDEGMLFVFDSSRRSGFWMKDMRFPIDILWISGGRLIGWQENAKPEPGKALYELTIYYPPGPVDRVLEINAGLATKLGLGVGDEVVFADSL